MSCKKIILEPRIKANDDISDAVETYYDLWKVQVDYETLTQDSILLELKKQEQRLDNIIRFRQACRSHFAAVQQKISQEKKQKIEDIDTTTSMYDSSFTFHSIV